MSERFSEDIKQTRERLPSWEKKICKVWSRKRLGFLRKWEKMATRWTVGDNVQASGKSQDSRRDTWCLQIRGREYKTANAAFTRRERRREGSRKERRTRKRKRKTKNREQNNSAETVIISASGIR